MVRLRVGKELPDTRQNEREINFIRVGDTVKTMGWLKGEPTVEWRLTAFLSFLILFTSSCQMTVELLFE